MTSRANCKIALTERTAPKPTKTPMTVKKGGKTMPITSEMIGAVLQRLMAA